MVDGATSNSKKVDSNDSFVPQIADRRPQIAFDPSIQSFHSILPFEFLTPQKTNEVLYKSLPRFEPTTFLIHDLSI